MSTTQDQLGLKGNTYREMAEDLLSRFKLVDRAELLAQMTAQALLDVRHGNQREERAACDWLNAMQREAVRLSNKAEPTAVVNSDLGG